MSIRKSGGCSYSKIFLATKETDSHIDKQTVYDAALEWADSDTEFSILHTVTPLNSPEKSLIQQELFGQAEDELLQLAGETGIEGKAKILAQSFDQALRYERALDKSTLAIVSNEQNDADATSIECDTLFVRQF